MKVKWLFTSFLFLVATVIEARPVVLLSIDGFKGQYIEQYHPPFISHLLKKSAYSTHMRPVFPSLTFPNHLSLVTGVYPAKHGIVGNHFYHRGLKKHYSYKANAKEGRFITTLPLWTIAEKNHLKTAIYFWPESETPIQGVLPSHYQKYTDSTSNTKRLKTIIDWLSLPKEIRPQLILGYFSTLDTAGHRYGPNTQAVRNALLKVDGELADFFHDLASKGLNDVDVVIVSDHGMTTVDRSHLISVNALNIPKGWQIENNHALLYLYNMNSSKEIKSGLERMAKNRYRIYQKGHYPSHWHLEGNPKTIPDLILLAEPPHVFQDGFIRSFAQGAHGFDPLATPDMDAIFIATGPSFKPQAIPKMKNLEVMPVMLTLLGLKKPRYLDGNQEIIDTILK